MSLLLLLRTPSATIHALTGVAFGQGVGAARLAVLRRMAGAASGQAAATGRLARVLPVAGLAAGGGTVSGALRVARALRGIAAASGTLAARLAVVRRLAGVAAGSATLGARLARVRPLAGEASGTSTVLGRASCVRSLAGVAAGWSRVSGFMLLPAGTPASRTLRVRREARTLRPAFEDRLPHGAARGARPGARRRGPDHPSASGKQGHRRMTFTKDPDAVLDYSVDWLLWLAGDQISSSEWILEQGATIEKITDTIHHQ